MHRHRQLTVTLAQRIPSFYHGHSTSAAIVATAALIWSTQRHTVGGNTCLPRRNEFSFRNMATTPGSQHDTAAGMNKLGTDHRDNGPRNIATTELEAKAARWVTLNVIDWEDQEGTRVSFRWSALRGRRLLRRRRSPFPWACIWLSIVFHACIHPFKCSLAQPSMSERDSPSGYSVAPVL